MKRRLIRRFVLSVAAATLASGSALAAGATAPAATPADPTPEQRQTMAEIHRKMADCLESERPFTECRNEMHAACQAQMGATGCPMMGGWGMGPGMMGGGMHRKGMGPPQPPQQP